MKKGFKNEASEYRVPLVPTKAALFGLDLRFRDMEEIIQAKKDRRRSSAFQTQTDLGGNRHVIPSEEVISKLKYHERR